MYTKYLLSCVYIYIHIGLLSYDHIHPDDIARTVAYHMELLADPRDVVPVYAWLRKKHKNGTYVHTEVVGTIQTAENGDRMTYGKFERVTKKKKGLWGGE
jgi:cbb3-type cytochrome oxidase cytochrome c subunit